MSRSMSHPRAGTPAATDRPWTARLARRALLARLDRLRSGRIELVDGPDRNTFGPSGEDALRATVHVRDPRFYAAVATGGSIGAGEAFALGYWSTDDLTSLVRILVRDRDTGEGLERGLARLRAPAERLRHRFRRNSRRGSRVNIAAHYDLGNEFFSTFLDETMMYSCAVFPSEDASLADASRHKNDRICRKLDLGPGDELLEIGTGWGGFAIHAAGSYGCRVTTATISREQCTYARERVRGLGLEDRITVLHTDYRELPRRLTRRFDKLVSIEMIEAVGHRYFDRYFRTCAEMLVPGGSMLLQAIVIKNELYDQYRRGVDFIQRYIFPGGCLPSRQAVRDSAARAGGLHVTEEDDITRHYPTTLRRWRERFLSNRERIRALGFDDVFMRLWEFYLCYCEGGFLERTIGDIQAVLAKPTSHPDGFPRRRVRGTT